MFRAAQIVHLCAFVLTPGVLRSAAGQTVQIRPGAESVRLQLRAQPPAGAITYQAVLATADGEELWREARLTGGAGGVKVLLPACVLAPGDYILSLKAFGEEHKAWNLPTYVFRLTPLDRNPDNVT